MTPYIHTVQYYETDAMRITHHSNYIRWMEEARVSLLQQIGYPYSRMEEIGLMSPVMEVSCKYKQPTRFEEKITITPSIREYNGITFKFAYQMTNEQGVVVCEATSSHCFLKSDGSFARVKRDHPELHALLTSISEDA